MKASEARELANKFAEKAHNNPLEDLYSIISSKAEAGAYSYITYGALPAGIKSILKANGYSVKAEGCGIVIAWAQETKSTEPKTCHKSKACIMVCNDSNCSNCEFYK